MYYGSWVRYLLPRTPRNITQIGSGSTVDLPDRFPGWVLDKQWSTLVRAFTDSWTSVSIADRLDLYPASMSGCASHRFLVRWRSITEVPVRFAVGVLTGDVGTIVEEELVEPTVEGWAQLHGCDWPLWQYVQQPSGSNLGDVAVELQHWHVSM